MSAGRFLSRWSQRKLSQAAPADTPLDEALAGVTAVPSSLPVTNAEAVAPVDLPDPAKLTLESDFTAFLKEEVGEAVRRQALKKLFNDPHFNVMDGLDIYIDDYSVSEPIPPEMLAKLRSASEWLAGREDDVPTQTEDGVNGQKSEQESAAAGLGGATQEEPLEAPETELEETLPSQGGLQPPLA
ncbi:DUF3306 domain-containing protein [Parazoarcus communis]|uniref:DUF3306 domain-containing protein n=1 Tax=Parazoarcus communis SWub3 = DSM 12120 TaxID=1121029 RepID=A0A323UU23_9RHOO|nr:DUF3306 domain-containing protein [Parazoarcus communis]NMG70702.1 DUF3306 domain-containing protein [Parazoarcus communis SWub3 = DSM 12120]PZA15513.1 DUF3306 domain-containing protein [Azoarcus communis] [Parazoarcus communis SWub3 = DSM 12120]